MSDQNLKIIHDGLRSVNRDIVDLQKQINRNLNPEIGPSLGELIGQYLGLPGLRGFWTMGPHFSGGNAADLSGLGKTLTYNGNPVYAWYGTAAFPFITLDGVGDFLSRADEADNDILGTETYRVNGYRGLTVGGWFYPYRGGTREVLMSKADGGTTGGLSWWLEKDAGNSAVMYVSNGTSFVTAGINIPNFVTGKWYFIVARYLPSSNMIVWINDVSGSNVTGIPASLLNVAQPFMIGGANNGATLLFNGSISMCFLSADAVHPEAIQKLYHIGRIIFGV